MKNIVVKEKGTQLQITRLGIFVAEGNTPNHPIGSGVPC